MSGSPRRLGDALRRLTEQVEPQTRLARVQAEWQAAAGAAFAAHCRPSAERDGVVTVVCDASVWAAELDLSQAEIVARLRRVPGLEGIASLRAQTGTTEI